MTMESPEALRLESMERFGFGPEAMKKARKCPLCGALAPADGERCPECGAALEGETLFEFYRGRHRVCPDCKTVVADCAGFCPQCGKKIK